MNLIDDACVTQESDLYSWNTICLEFDEPTVILLRY